MRARTLVLLFAPSPVLAATLEVGPSKSHTTIQSAIDAAADGDEIVVDPATYTERLAIDKDVTVRGRDGAETTFVELGGLQTGAVVSVTDAAVVRIEGLTVRGGSQGLDVASSTLELVASTITGNGGITSGTGLVVRDGADVTVRGSTFTDNTAPNFADGGHVRVEASDLRVEASTFTGGEARDGAGIHATGTSGVTLEDVVFEDNSANRNGGALFFGDEVTATLTGGRLEGNDAASGGGVHATGTVTLDAPTFRANSAGTGAGAFFTGATVTSTGALFADHDAAGSPLHLAGDATFDGIGDRFEGNRSGDVGGAVRIVGEASATFAEALFTDNEGSDGGALAHTSSGALAIETSTFADNAASGRGAGMFWSPSADTATLDLSGTAFTGNTAQGDGGAVFLASGVVSVLDNAMTGNQAQDGGALALVGTDALTLRRNRLCANTASGSGGGVYADDAGADAFAWTNNVHARNTAAIDGGGAFVTGGATVSIVNDSFLGNAATRGGGAYVASEGFDFRNNLVAWSTGRGGLATDQTTRTVTHNAFYESADGHFATGDSASTPDDTHLVDIAPELVAFDLEGDCADDAPWPALGSPLVDAGDPAVEDPDSGRSDIGAYGGPDADPAQWRDDDADDHVVLFDCDDGDDTVWPGAPEQCDGVDHDCDGLVDEPDSTDAATWYADDDADGYGDDADTITACDAPDGYTDVGGDCDDSSPAYNPGVVEECGDTEDFDCDGSAGADDLDEDGFLACEDCDDTDPDVNPDADERCNGVDDDCDGEIDDDPVDTTSWYADADGDGFGDDDDAVDACEAPEGRVSEPGDCDDTDGDVHPDADELCNGVDDDCDGEVDDDAIDTLPWYADADGDGWGTAGTEELACEAPDGFVDQHGDCDDGDPDVHPDADDAPGDDVDQDCDGTDADARSGCGCSTAPSGSGVGGILGGLLALVTLRRRR